MEALSDRQVPKSWSQQLLTGKLLQTAHRLTQVAPEARRRAEPQGGGGVQTRKQGPRLGCGTVARAAEPTRLRGNRLN